MIFALVVVGCFTLSVGMFFGYLLGANAAANTHADELDRVGDDCYADGYEQRRQDERAGIQRLPTHRP